jgi:hypothetical protein
MVKYIYLPPGAPICCCGPPKPPIIGSCADLPSELTLHYELWEHSGPFNLVQKISDHTLTLSDLGGTNPRRWKFAGYVECGPSDNTADPPDPDTQCNWLEYELRCQPDDDDSYDNYDFYYDAEVKLLCGEGGKTATQHFILMAYEPGGSGPSTPPSYDLFDHTTDPWELRYQQKGERKGGWWHAEGDCVILPIRITL